MGETLSCCDSRNLATDAGQKIFYNQQSLDQDLPKIPITIQTLMERAKTNIYYIKPKIKEKDQKTFIKISSGKIQVFYHGEIKNNQAHGYGLLYLPKNMFFQGLFDNGLPVNGVLAFNEKTFYVGGIHNFQAEGKGFYENKEINYIYDGQWSKSLPHGYGYQKLANGDIYQGQFMFGSKFGKGQYTFHNGTYYVGQFYNGNSDGKGKIILKNEDQYDGQWKLGTMDGKGIYKWANGQIYDGEYRNGKRHGYGKYKFINGSIYQGQWIQGYQDGKGKIRQGYDQVEGIWKLGKIISQQNK